jgi:hypothetical protein
MIYLTTVQRWIERPASSSLLSKAILLPKAGRLTTPIATQNRKIWLQRLLATGGPMRKTANTSKDIRDSEGSGGDVRRTSYTLPPPPYFVWVCEVFV